MRSDLGSSCFWTLNCSDLTIQSIRSEHNLKSSDGDGGLISPTWDSVAVTRTYEESSEAIFQVQGLQMGLSTDCSLLSFYRGEDWCFLKEENDLFSSNSVLLLPFLDPWLVFSLACFGTGVGSVLWLVFFLVCFKLATLKTERLGMCLYYLLGDVWFW